VNPAGATITLLVGAVILRLSITGTYRRYVREGMGVWLTIAGAVVVVLGAVALVRALQGADDADVHGDNDHAGAARVGWLLLAPIAALLLVAPPTLGAYGVGRAPAVDVRAGASTFEPLAAGTGPRPMTLLEFGQRAFDHDGATFNDVPVELTGFVAEADDGGFRLARYQIGCCAADAAPVVIRVVGIAGTPPPRDQWVTVVGEFRPGSGDLPQVSATSVAEIAPPDDPYE
jgi:uncharacterized repeat protein (TIGR03943 family)